MKLLTQNVDIYAWREFIVTSVSRPSRILNDRRVMPSSAPLQPFSPNRIIRGIGDGVYAIVNNAPIRIHSVRNNIQIVERIVPEHEIEGELLKLEKVRERFASAKKMEDGDTFALMISPSLDNAVGLVRDQRINADAALHRFVAVDINALRENNYKIDVKMQELRSEVSKLSINTSMDRNERLAGLDDLDGRIERIRGNLTRQKAFVEDLSSLLDSMILYMQAREEDVEDKGVIHVADALTWPEIQYFFSRGARGFVLNSAFMGPVNHPFIFAHENGIPLVVIKDPLSNIDVSRRISIDSRTGHVIVDPTSSTIASLAERAKSYEVLARIFKEHAGSSQTLDGKPLPQLYANIKDREDLVHIKGQGVGLFRTEGMYAQDRPAPQTLVRVFKALIGKTNSATIRLFDVAPDKIPAFFTEADLAELKKTKGGINFLLNSKIGRSILVDQIKSLLIAYERLAHKGKVKLDEKTIRILIPMVSTPEEVRAVNRIIEEEEKGLIERGHLAGKVSDKIEVSIMIETSAAVANAELLADEVSYFSIGGNDLTQDLLGFGERRQLMTGKQFDWMSPVVLRSIKHVVDVAKKKGIPVGSCGEISRDPMAAIVLTLMGMDILSMDDSYRNEINYILSKIHIEEWQKFSEADPEKLSVIDRLLKLADALEVREYIFNLLRTKAHADTQIALEGVIPSAKPTSYIE